LTPRGGDGELAPGLVIDRHTFGDPLGDQAPLEMRDRSEDMKNQLAGGRVRVDPVLQAEQGNAALLEHGDSREQLASERPSRSRRTTASVSPSRAYASKASRPGRSIVLPERISPKTLMAPASVSRMVRPATS